ncbi:MAG TPA: 50S ribosomal protein L21 [Myxococcota bacterium]|nr:50S ribosomal protein L21 [Myxococcota bacterium]
MYAIVESGNKQYRVAVGDTITVDRLECEDGAEFTLDRVLLIGGDDVKVGTPIVEGASVSATVVSNTKGPKVITFKYKRRQRSRVKKGFRACHTTLQITAING